MKRRLEIAEGGKARRGEAVAGHKSLGKCLGGLDLGRRPAGAKGRNAHHAQDIHDAVGQRGLGTDHDQVDVLLLAETGNSPVVIHPVQRQGYVLAQLGGPGVAGGDIQLLQARRLSDLPCQGVLAPARANQ